MTTKTFTAANDNVDLLHEALVAKGVYKEIDRAFPDLWSPAHRALLMADAKRLYEQLFPETKAGAAQALGAKRAHGKASGQSPVPAFVTIVVRRAQRRRGWSESSIRQVVLRGEKIATKVLKAIISDESKTGTIYPGHKLDRLAAEPASKQMDRYHNGWPPDSGGPQATGARYFRDGIELHCVDALKRMDEMAQRGELVPCIVVDPPYGINYVPEGRDPIAGDDDPVKAAHEFVPRMARLLKPGRAMCIWTSEKVLVHWVKALNRAGLSVHATIEWDKVNPWFEKRVKEILIVASKGEVATFNDDNVDSWAFGTVRDPELRKMHSTPKPWELMERALLRYSKPGELVFDPCAGLAPVGRACIETDRRCLGIELVERHFLNARSRLDNALAANAPSPEGVASRTDFEVKRIEHAAAKRFIERHHYSQTCPTGYNVFFGAFLDGELYAVADYGIGANMDRGASLSRLTGHPVRYVDVSEETLFETRPNVNLTGLTVGSRNCLELRRLVRVGEKGEARIPLTRFLAICHRLLKRDEGIQFIVSYSDPGELRTEKVEGKWRVVGGKQNTGTIYRAANFLHLGTTGSTPHTVRVSDGEIVHRRTVQGALQRWNAKNPAQPKTIDEIREVMGLDTIRTPPKERWFIDLSPALRLAA